MDDLALWPRLFLTLAPPLAVLVLAFRWRFAGLLAALALSFALFLTVCALQGAPWHGGWSLDATANPAIRAAFTGAFWAWALGLPAAGLLFAAWCRARVKS